MAAEAGGVGPDPGGVQAAIDRYRDLAKYLITIFAAVGAVLVAGTQLASIGELSFDDEPDRFIAVIVGLILAIGAIAGVVALALRVLRPVEMTFAEVLSNEKLSGEIARRPWLLGGAGSLDEVRDNLATQAISDADRETWLAVANDVVGYAAYLKAREAFENTWWPLLGAGVVAVIGITAFTWGANPPEDSSKPPIIEPAPQTVRISLTSDGREALAGALGGERCVEGVIKALAIGGTASKPKVVTLPRSTCRSAQFVLTAGWGAASPE